MAADTLIGTLPFQASLLTKPFVILTGLSGSGKTKLAQAFVKWICADASQYSIVAVGADWTNREPLLGYADALNSERYEKLQTGVIDLLVNAGKNPDRPYFLILDEMNLSHVERYFADFLSTMESKENISLHPGPDDKDEVPSSLHFPPNLFIIGTVNIDETTYMFSPKVLDRANVIEFRISEAEMAGFVHSEHQAIDLDSLAGNGKDMASAFVDLAAKKQLPNTHSQAIAAELLKFFKQLQKVGAEFGYRTASEIMRFAGIVEELGLAWNTEEILDVAIMQKLLPKLHGSRKKLKAVLEELAKLCTKDGDISFLGKEAEFDLAIAKAVYPISLEKIIRMHNNLMANGFTSYAEA